MGNTYKHGVYAEIEKSGLTAVNKSLGTIPAYIGTLPLQRLNKEGKADFNYQEYVNRPMLVSSYRDVEDLYSENWASYTLCEVIHAHFLNGNEVVAPIILVPMSFPDASEEASEKEIVLEPHGNKLIGYLEDEAASIANIAITAKDTTFNPSEIKCSYSGDKVKIEIEVTETKPVEVTVTYKTHAIDMDEIFDDSAYMSEAIEELDYCEVITGYIPNIIAAPGFSHDPAMHSAMVQLARRKIEEKWNFITVSDLPSNYSGASVDEWKNQNGYTDKLDKVCFPMVSYRGKVYHLSTIVAYTMQLTDLNNDNVPSVSPSNKVINADGASTGFSNNAIVPALLKEAEVNKLGEKGITTVKLVHGQWRLWGSHMANYEHDKLSSIDYEDRSDSGIRMQLYIANMLQYEYLDTIDTPIKRSDIDSVQNSIQQRFNALVNEGKLLYATVRFDEASNSEADLASGDITFDVEYTLAPNVKSVTFKMRYTSTGLSLLTSGGEA